MNENLEILKQLDDREPEKKPRNGIWLALFFSDLIFFLLDIGSGLGVYWLTGLWYYGLLVFFSGFIPLLLHQKLYTRAYANQEQKTAALVGIGVSIFSVLVIAVVLGAVRFVVTEQYLWMLEAGLAVTLVLLAFTHAMITVFYYFKDEEIAEGQRTSRIIARADRQLQRIRTADRVAIATKKQVQEKQKFSGRFSPEILAKIEQLMRDEDGDGIPDFMDPVDNRTGKGFDRTRQYAQTTERVKFSDNGRGDQDPNSGRE